MSLRSKSSMVLPVLLIAIVPNHIFAAERQVRTEAGVVEGVTDSSSGVTGFKGIPYAAPPVGNLRWQPPAPVRRWEGVRKADKYAAPCMQIPITALTGVSALELNERVRLPAAPSEDCLTLNVWSPAKSSSDRLPVMFWIHGGGLYAGSPGVPRTEGGALAAKGVVLVSVNYRLGVFGFLAHPELTRESDHRSSGNYGLLDQLAALRWVSKNIAAFGGDPNNVTIFGESAGAWSVNVLVASPIAKGLFRRAIGQSGALFAGSRQVLSGQLRPLAEAEQAGLKFALALGAKSLSELRSKSADEILKAPGSQDSRGVTIDGWLLPDSPERIFETGRQNDVPILIGSNDDEGAAFGQAVPSVEAWRRRASELFGGKAGDFLKLYPASTDEEARKSSTTFFGDAAFGLQMRRWARLQSRTGKSPAYLYSFNRASPDAECRCATHASEIVYVFRTVFSSARPFQNVDRQVSDAISSYWVNFAKTGNPNGTGLPQWPVYSPKNDVVLVLGDQIAAKPVPHKPALDFLEEFFTGPQ